MVVSAEGQIFFNDRNMVKFLNREKWIDNLDMKI